MSQVLADDRWSFCGLFWKSLTLYPWRERQLRAGGGAARCGPGCSRQPGGEAWTVREESLLADRRLDGLLRTASDGHESKRLIRARSSVLRQARLCELQMNGRYDDDAKSIRVCGQIQRQNSFSVHVASVWPERVTTSDFVTHLAPLPPDRVSKIKHSSPSTEFKIKFYVVRWQEGITSASVRLLNWK